MDAAGNAYGIADVQEMIGGRWGVSFVYQSASSADKERGVDMFFPAGADLTKTKATTDVIDGDSLYSVTCEIVKK